MPHSKCWDCSRRIKSSATRYRIGQPKLWPLYEDFHSGLVDDSDKGRYICEKCYFKVKSQLRNAETYKFPSSSTPTPDSSFSPFQTRSKRRREEDETVLPEDEMVLPEDEMVLPEDEMVLPEDEMVLPEDEGVLPEDEGSRNSPHSNSSTFDREDARMISQSMQDETLPLPEMLMMESQQSTASTSSQSQRARRLPNIPSVTSSQKRCFLCKDVSGRRRVPKEALAQAWIQRSILIPHGNRCCPSHLEGKKFSAASLNQIVANKHGVLMNDEELCEWMLGLGEACKTAMSNRRKYDFDDINSVKEEDYPLLIGFSKTHFDELLKDIEGKVHSSVNRSPRNALAMLLIILRQGLSQEVVGNLFGIQCQSTVSRTITSVATALEDGFVKRNLGWEHISREDIVKNHSLEMYYTLFEEDDRSKAFVIMDGTYLYMEKPQDFELQKLLWSGQKKRNLVKPFMSILADGHILDASVPFGANGANNDSGILKALLPEIIKSKAIQPGDHLVLDRGFRDVITTLEDKGISTHMPSLLKKTVKQFTALEGNESRRVTLVRWLVEAVNGRLKKKFKLFRDTIPGGYLEKIGTFFRIACALVNRFCQPLVQDTPRRSRIAEKALDLMEEENRLKIRVENGNEKDLDRNIKKWKKLSADVFEDFPTLSKEDLETLTLGIYQTRLAPRYAKNHFSEDGDYTIEVNEDIPGVIRARIESRFAYGKAHRLWIEYDADLEGAEAITGMYCRCKQGSRVVGCCSHCCSLIWYLGFYRHQENPSLHIRKRKLSIRDAGKELALEDDQDSDDGEDDQDSDDGRLEDEDEDSEFERFCNQSTLGTESEFELEDI